MSFICILLLVVLTCANAQNNSTNIRVEATEAQQIALESQSDQLLAPTSSQIVQTIQEDLTLIRTQYPVVQNIHHTPKWTPGEILAKDVTDEQIRGINGSHYGPIVKIQRFTIIPYAVLTFQQLFNPILLGQKMKETYGFISEPNGLIGGSQFITYDIPSSTYRFEQGKGDCPSGCIERQSWYFQVSRTTQPPIVTLLKTEGKNNNRN
jgi:hypothetical protein